jgi:leucyl/phenylalanyl-tRNA---protein transferase
MELTPEMLLQAYQHGFFPMAHPEENHEIYWYAPDPRAIIPLDRFHIPQALARLVNKGVFDVVSDRGFENVIRACASRNETWISEEIIGAYVALHEAGFAHSVECWRDGELAGGLYGVSIAGAFFGESMFHRGRDASKVALVHLVQHLKRNGFTLLDIQFMTPHLARFGAVEISKSEYEQRLRAALAAKTDWYTR